MSDIYVSEVKYNAREYLSLSLLGTFLIGFVYLAISCLPILFYIPVILSPGVVSLVVTLLLFVFYIVLYNGFLAGYYSCHMNIHRLGYGSFGDLFSNFNLWFGVFKIQFIVSFKVFLWSLIPLAGVFLVIRSYLANCLAIFVYLDDPYEKTTGECIIQSKILTSFNKAKLFFLVLSNIFWMFLMEIFIFVLTFLYMKFAGFSFLGKSFYLDLNNLDFTASEIIFSLISIFILCLACSALISPLLSYFTMSLIEFYYMRDQGELYSVGDESYQSVSEKLILIFATLILSCGLAVGSGFFMQNNGNAVEKISAVVEAQVDSESGDGDSQKVDIKYKNPEKTVEKSDNGNVKTDVNDPNIDVIEDNTQQDGVPDTTNVDSKLLDKAQTCLKYSNYSRSGLISMLMRTNEGLSEADATKAVDALNKNWNSVAVDAAKDYLENSDGVSYSNLKDFLTLDGFSESEINYAVNHLQVSWSAQAKKRVESFLKYDSSITNEEIYNQLIFEKFSSEDAKKAIKAVGR